MQKKRDYNLGMRRFYLPLAVFVLASTSAAIAGASNVESQLQTEYQNKLLLLRGFYSGGHLMYDSSGAVQRSGSSGDWTTDGVVRVKKIQLDKSRLSIDLDRFLIAGGGELHILANGKKKPKKSDSLKVVWDLGTTSPNQSQVDAAMGKVFLMHDSLEDNVPDYWKPCIRAALSGGKSVCRFSPDLLSIPGFTISRQQQPDASENSSQHLSIKKIGGGVSPPRQLFAPEPSFAESARAIRYEGTLTLGLVVDEKGQTTNIHVLYPLGCGLDAKAVEAVRNWRFEPAKKDGQPVAVQIAVEVDFHLY